VANVGSLTAGTYNGNIQMTAAGASSLNIPVTLVVTSPTQFAQQGAKLVGSGAGGTATQGRSVALSADGNTAIVGGLTDSNSIGAAWTFARTGGAWIQQGSKLVGSGAVQGAVSQGISVALSADGNTAIVGGIQDNNNFGAVWVYMRTGGVWMQQGDKLVGTGAVGSAFQGRSVALSADGNTAIVGGNGDNNTAGAAWVFTRTGGVWTQQGGKLVGTGAVGNAFQGSSVAMAADGNTAIIGGENDNNGGGAAWVFTRIGNAWTQQGGKLAGSGAVGNAFQGSSVAMATDGNTAIIGGTNDNNGAGAAWVFTRIGGVWTQQGGRLVGTGAVGNAFQGFSVSISGDSNTAIVGGYGDNNNAGAAWVFSWNGREWVQDGSKLVGTWAVGVAQQGLSVALSADSSTVMLGGWLDNNSTGAVWVFVNPNAAVPVITWPKPANISFGSALGNGQLNATASVPGKFAYSPAAGTVLPVGGGQVLSVTFTPSDTKNYSTASASTTISIVPGTVAGAQIILTQVLKRGANNDIVVQLTLANAGLTAASNVTLTNVRVGTVLGTPLPQTVGTIGSNALAQTTVTVPGSAGAAGAAGSLAVTGTYSGGNFSVTSRIVLP
jgi:hypothetical protein